MAPRKLTVLGWFRHFHIIVCEIHIRQLLYLREAVGVLSMLEVFVIAD